MTFFAYTKLKVINQCVEINFLIFFFLETWGAGGGEAIAFGRSTRPTGCGRKKKCTRDNITEDTFCQHDKLTSFQEWGGDKDKKA